MVTRPPAAVHRFYIKKTGSVEKKACFVFMAVVHYLEHKYIALHYTVFVAVVVMKLTIWSVESALKA